MDAKKILDQVSDGSTKTRFTVSIDEKLFEEFKRICGARPVSPVVEAILRDFCESARESKRAK